MKKLIFIAAIVMAALFSSCSQKYDDTALRSELTQLSERVAALEKLCGKLNENIESLQTNKEKLQAYQLLCDYALNHTEPDLSDKKPCAAAVFRAVRPVLDAAHRRAENMTTVRNSTPTPAKDPLY